VVAKYLVVHSPINLDEETPRKPSDMIELARAHGGQTASPRWLRTWSPDLHDDRIFTLWEATNGEAITDVLGKFGFLDDMLAEPLRVQEWGPEDVLAAHGEHILGAS
jgi:hypothetical protein